MRHLPILLGAILASLGLGTSACGAESRTEAVHRQAPGQPLTERTLTGTYVFSGQVLLNPVTDMSDPQMPVRSLVSCFSVGEMEFDGAGGLFRKVEIFCPTTPVLLAAGLAPPPPLGEPSEQQLGILGSTLTSEGDYTVSPSGWGEWHEEGEFRLGPVPNNPASGYAQFSVGKLDPSGKAEEIHFVIKNQSLQAPGAPMLINSDMGGSFVARRRR
ncbi:MAG TPA: hypothetical protein VJ984_08400 [Xanthomonadales bacterium]|nr:hypothetical protein [Xanthomonadales bacterium]